MPPWLLPLQAASTASYDASQPYMKVGFIQGPRLIPQGYIKRPPDPQASFNSSRSKPPTELEIIGEGLKSQRSRRRLVLPLV
jgi:hypothetical protein